MQSFGSSSLAAPSIDTLEKVQNNIFAYYSMILTVSVSNILSLKSTWETDLKVTFTETEWRRIIVDVNKMSREV